MDGGLQSPVAGKAADHEALLAAASRYRSNPCQGAQGESTPTNHCTLSTTVGSPRSRRATAILIDPCTGALGAMTSYWISIAAAPSGRGSYAGAQAQVDK